MVQLWALVSPVDFDIARIRRDKRNASYPRRQPQQPTGMSGPSEARGLASGFQFQASRGV